MLQRFDRFEPHFVEKVVPKEPRFELNRFHVLFVFGQQSFLLVALPGLRLQDEQAAFLQEAIDFGEQSFDPFVTPVQVYPLRHTETLKCV